MTRACHGTKGCCAIQDEHIRILNGPDNGCHALCHDNVLMTQNHEINYVTVLYSVTFVL